MTTIGLVRHGQTDWNVEKRAQGSSDIPLNGQGKSEAERVMERLSDEKWDVIYTSPLRRAKETAEAINRALNIPLYEDERLVEVSGGEIEGTTEQERLAKWGENWRSLDLGIEKSDLVLRRVRSVIQEIKEKHPDERVLAVTHGGVIGHVVSIVAPDQEGIRKIGNTAVTEVVWEENEWQCKLFNCMKHI